MKLGGDMHIRRPSAASGPFAAARRWFARLSVALALAAIASAASAAAYISDSITDLKPEDKVVVAAPQPVQLIFQFQTKGAPNARATKLLKQKVIDTVKASGLFSSISDDAVPNGAILSISINDIASPKDMSDAEGKGVITGATFFVVGSNIADHYLCTVDYVASPTAPKIERTARHALIVQMGIINSPPPNAVKIGGVNEAIYTMVRQIVSNPLNEVAKDPGFLGASAASQAPPPAASEAAASSSPAAQAGGSSPGPTASPDTTPPASQSAAGQGLATPSSAPAAASGNPAANP